MSFQGSEEDRIDMSRKLAFAKAFRRASVRFKFGQYTYFAVSGAGAGSWGIGRWIEHPGWTTDYLYLHESEALP